MLSLLYTRSRSHSFLLKEIIGKNRKSMALNGTIAVVALLMLHLLNTIDALILVGQVPKAERMSTVSSWAETGYRWVSRLNCSQQSIFAEENCDRIQAVKKAEFRLYAATPAPDKKYGTVFPDSDTKKHKTFHDGVMVLDPFPAARFGHPIMVFHVDINMKYSQCEILKGIMTDNGACLQPFSRAFNNILSYNYRSRMLPMAGPSWGEVLYLPLVHFQVELPVQRNDKLTCYSSIQGFNQSCPLLRSESDTSNVSCDFVLTNRDCLVLENRLNNRCTTWQTCDHAVLLSGGWNRQLSDVSTYHNVMNMKHLLITHGYLETNIEVFYANGKETQEDETEGYYASSLKTAMRNHIKTVCDSEYCSDTLFIYMNSPTRPDGSSLLWDKFDNGLYDKTEIYTTKELMRDIAHCGANRVIVMADQSYGGALIDAAEARFTSLENVMIFTSSDEFNWNSTSKDRLTKYLLRHQRNDICLNDFKYMFYYTHKSPVYIGWRPNLLNSTLVGGPCTGKSNSLNDRESFKYRGCSLSPVI